MACLCTALLSSLAHKHPTATLLLPNSELAPISLLTNRLLHRMQDGGLHQRPLF